MTTAPPGPVLALSDAAALLGVHPKTLRKAAELGRLPYFRTPGGHRRFRRTDIEAFIRRAS